MKSTRTGLRRGSSLLASLGVLASLLAFAPPARAQLTAVCGFLDGAADELYGTYIGELGDEWGFELDNEALCNRLAKNFLKACEQEIEDIADCSVKQLRNLGKQNRAACKATADEVDECTSFYDAHEDADVENVLEQRDEELEECDARVEIFFDICLNGV
jgi:hypothetical protein